jgi:SAM-dependent methyltransferase
MSKASGFQVSGSAAELYERYAVPYVLGPWAPELVDLALLKRGERVLDLACGTGVVARLAASRVGSSGHVIGIDLNAGMLAVASALPPPSGAAIVWHVDIYTATKYRENRVVPTAEDLDRLLTEAGFSGVDIRSSLMTIRLPPIEQFVLCHLSASPVAGSRCPYRH